MSSHGFKRLLSASDVVLTMLFRIISVNDYLFRRIVRRNKSLVRINLDVLKKILKTSSTDPSSSDDGIDYEFKFLRCNTEKQTVYLI